jgi:hypothetical protein
MNLKESFRYQKFLDGLMQQAQSSICDRNHALKVTKTHLRNRVNSEAEDKVEEIDVGEFIPNDDVLTFMQYLIGEKERLSCAIGKAKASCGFDIDAAVETNKYRQNLRSSVGSMLRNTAAKRTERGSDYKFNVEGNQTPYSYDVEVESSEAFDRDVAKTTMKEVIAKADEVSREIDMALINTVVEYNTPFDVNDSFEDAVKVFLSKTA